ncbi:MAG: aminoglycoside phosphotransferase family protein [Actinomycetota bacterium]
MSDEPEGLRRWASCVWHDWDWTLAVHHHGAFHDVLVLRCGPVARIATGAQHGQRVAREASVLAILAALDLPVTVPRLVAEPVTHAGHSGVLTSRVPGRTITVAAWPDVRDQLLAALDALRRSATGPEPLPEPRQWCGGKAWPELVSAQLAPRLPPRAGAAATQVVDDVLEVERDVAPGLVHGDFGLHNVMWRGMQISGLIDFDHACSGDPAIDIAPLVGIFGAQHVGPDVEPEVLQRAMYHRASLSLQVAAAAELAGKHSLRDHALGNFARRFSEGTLHDPGGRRPRMPHRFP